MNFYPNYNNGILNLINSILKYYGAEYTHSTLKTLDKLLEKQYRNVVLMVFDALGSRNLMEIMGPDSFLRQHMVEEITSAFPPTTTAATTTLESGLSPAEHAWLGWSLHFSEVNDNVNIFINTNDNGENAAEYHVAGRYIPYKSTTEKINETNNARAESISPFGTCRVETVDEMMKAVKKLCMEDGRHYLYTYWTEPDSSMHKNGIMSREAVEWVHRINDEVERLSSQLNDTLLIVTADHGHIDSQNRFIDDYPDILNTLKWLPSIEPRALAFHVKDGMEKEFKEAFLKHFKDSFILLSRQEVLDEKLFGDGNLHPRFSEFIGDFLAVAVSNESIFISRREYENFIGVHAGLTEKEMMVPLIIVECP